MTQILQEKENDVTSMRTVSLIINARWVVPVIPKDTVYDYYSVIIDGKDIIDCLPTKVIFRLIALFLRKWRESIHLTLWLTSCTTW